MKEVFKIIMMYTDRQTEIQKGSQKDIQIERKAQTDRQAAENMHAYTQTDR